ncbi:MAG: outer membrane protein assembly factor BamE [Geminicoccaceae bacterium]|nr:outer membrane protein assembly factor BamE [Geminicoccaceae bacterium]
MPRRSLPLGPLCGLALGLAACTPSVVPHGNIVSKADLEKIRPGDTRDEVMQALGSPSMQGTFDDRHWYYVTQETEVRSFFQKDIKEQDVVAVQFDGDGRVQAVRRSGLEQAASVDPVADKTRTLGNEPSLLQQLLGNIGRFDSGEGTPPAPRRVGR